MVGDQDYFDDTLDDLDLMNIDVPAKSSYSLDLDMLKQYYAKHFPFVDFYRFLQYQFPFREFSFTLPQDIYVRFKSFESITEFKMELVQKVPIKIDIGGIYDTKPKDKRITKSFQCLQKEFVLDIDLTDYDDVRTCCKEATICEKCWLFIVAATKIIDASLEENFGFMNRMWVFSGRRGVHCWIADEEAVKMTTEERRALIMWFSAPNKSKHPFVQNAMIWCQKLFAKLLKDMDIFKDDEKLIELVPAALRDKVGGEISKCEGSQEKWKKVVQLVSDQNVINSIIVKYTWPRLDQNVSIGLNHLLKSPFCVHPKTGNMN
jgi:DNA primase small subunit